MVDVCMVVEGTYPYLTGGVSAWVQEHVEALDEMSFSVVHLSEDADGATTARYLPPPNVSVLDVALDPEQDLAARNVAASLPEAGVYHGLTSGRAGVAAAAAAELRNRPFLLTEHGLAWREAAAGISGCSPHGRVPRGQGARAHEARARHGARVRAMARDNYARASAITTVCEHNRRHQRLAGAPADRLGVIPNPAPVVEARPANEGSVLRVGLVARVVAIKDVLTFIRACAVVAPILPPMEFLVIGPDDHEAEYAARCREEAEMLGLSERLLFTGETDPTPWYPLLDVVVLTSLSEAQPRVLLEAMAAGIPVVATAVGGCAELVSGGAGLLTAVGDVDATAAALVALGRDRLLRERLGATGRRRAITGYAPDRVHAAWRDLYGRWLEGPARGRARRPSPT